MPKSRSGVIAASSSGALINVRKESGIAPRAVPDHDGQDGRRGTESGRLAGSRPCIPASSGASRREVFEEGLNEHLVSVQNLDLEESVGLDPFPPGANQAAVEAPGRIRTRFRGAWRRIRLAPLASSIACTLKRASWASRGDPYCDIGTCFMARAPARVAGKGCPVG